VMPSTLPNMLKNFTSNNLMHVDPSFTVSSVRNANCSFNVYWIICLEWEFNLFHWVWHCWAALGNHLLENCPPTNYIPSIGHQSS
jgi:hypothetical protein